MMCCTAGTATPVSPGLKKSKRKSYDRYAYVTDVTAPPTRPLDLRDSR